MESVRVTAEISGERADSFLVRALPGITRNAAQRLLEEGLVCLGDKRIKKNYRVTKGESFFVTLPDLAEAELKAQELPLDVVFEDEDVIVVNKPRGMVVHPAPGHPDGTLVNALMFRCGESLSGIGGEKRPGIVHRIDKDTSGLIIAAKNDMAHRSLSKQLSDRSLSRVYEAVVTGRVRDDSGVIDAPVGRHPRERKRMAVTEKNSRRAVTRYEVIARYNGYTHVRCELETGRTHQIRVHMSHIGHPLVGDRTYGRKKPDKGLEGQCLHAIKLKFSHPRTGERIELSSELPQYFIDTLKKLGPEE